MSAAQTLEPGHWTNGKLPANVRVGPGSVIIGDMAFKRFRSEHEQALTIGSHCTTDGAHFALGADAQISIGDFCYFTNAILLCELEIRIGSYVIIGWNATVADTDFHPIAPAERIADAVACSPLGASRARPEIARCPVIIDDDVWIGPNATILKGVRIGSGAIIEPGALITHDVLPGARVIGNSAQFVGEAGR